MPQDLRTFVAMLARRAPEQLKIVTAEVDPEFEVAAIIDRIEDDARYPGFPAVLFTNVRGSRHPVLINLHGTYERLAMAIGTDLHGMVPTYAAREGSPVPTVTDPVWAAVALIAVALPAHDQVPSV